MKGRTVFFTVVAVGLWLAVAAPSHASTITTPGPGTGLTYEFGVTMNGNDSAIYEGNVGAKSWNEPLQPLGEKGWTHTTDWTALTLNEAADLTVTLARTTAGGGLLTPAFTIYSGQEHVESDSTHHTFNNIGNIAWTTALTYMDHEANLGRAASISKTFSLGPGLYSLVYGGHPISDLTELDPLDPKQNGQHGFQATLTTAPVPVPAALWLFGSGLAGLVGLARRRMTA